MFKVEKNKLNKIADWIRGIACVGVVAAMIFFFQDIRSYYTDPIPRLVALIIYIGVMLLMLVLAYDCFDTAVMYMIVDRNEFRIKHLFRKEVTYSRDRLTKWKCYVQFLRTGGRSTNIVMFFDKKARVEFAMYTCDNFDMLMGYLSKYCKDKEQNQ